MLERYVYASQAHVPDVIVRRDGQRLRLVLDVTGSVRAAVDADSGVVLQRLSYDAYGRVTQDTNPGLQPFGYKGAFSDPVAEGAGLVWMGVRAYTPKLARFTTPDPVGLKAGWNQHDALASDPVNLSDADGRQATSTQPVPVPGFWPFPSAQELEDFGHAVNEVGNQLRNLFDSPVDTLDPMADSLSDALQVCVDRIEGETPPVPVPDVDETGKVHGELPPYPPEAWDAEDLQDAADALEASIERRKEVSNEKGWDQGHADRIRQERDLLESIRRKLGSQ